MKIVVWTGNEPNQKALVNKIHSLFPLTAIVSESRTSHNNISFSRLAEKAVEKAFLPAIGRAWMELNSPVGGLAPTWHFARSTARPADHEADQKESATP